MERNVFRNHSFQEGILFLVLGGALLMHGLDGHSQSFNQDWSQSPYLFPVLVAVLVGGLAVSLLWQGMKAVRNQGCDAATRPGAVIPVLVVFGMSLLYYLLLAVLKIPYITFGVLSWSFTISNFEVVTFLFLIAMMLYLGVRKATVLALVPLGTTLFLSVAFRAMLHVLLP